MVRSGYVLLVECQKHHPILKSLFLLVFTIAAFRSLQLFWLPYELPYSLEIQGQSYGEHVPSLGILMVPSGVSTSLQTISVFFLCSQL